ncbi:nucleotide exchange factor GrpE [Patescibacteria group bacterium]|nr:nucleotide exchange factor GrpE [Patescibacteria group bacterium]MBU1473130.1 nucleotide exchange factor GrpE [Patescibacteria group bacterium]MBU2459666.1 nucleotide exchange factor GrpE [Patescibacteria group bacterium]MBU2544232.1 nucleotide exchange factor GrpE [Patescibacteria group bacterium]
MKKHTDEQKRELQKQVETWKSKYMRALADYQNLEKRTFAEKEETRRFAVQIFLERLLPVLDTLEQVHKHTNDQGLSLALKELNVLLSEYNVEKMKTAGTKFNPHVMECIEVVTGEDDVVIKEILAGYKMHGKVLRAAKVKVGRKQ